MSPTDIQRSIDLLKQIEDHSGRCNSRQHLFYVCLGAREVIEDLRKDRERLEFIAEGDCEVAFYRDGRCLVDRSPAFGGARKHDPAALRQAIDEAMTQRGEG